MNDVIIPATVALHIEKGGIITIADGKTLTVTSIDAGLYQCFAGPGTVKLNGGNVYPEWWGAVGDGITDDQAAMQAALNANSGSLVLTRNYKLNTSVIVPAKRNWTIEGRSPGSSGDNTKNTLIAGVAINHLIQFKNSYYSIRIKNILFDAANTATDCVQMGTNVTNGDTTIAGNFVNIVFENCEFNRAKRFGVCAGDPNSAAGVGAVAAPQTVSGNGMKFVDCQFSSVYGFFINWGNWYGTIFDNVTFSRAELAKVSSDPDYYGQKEMVIVWAGEDLKLRNVYFSGIWQANTYNILSYSAGISLDHVYSEHYNLIAVLAGAVYPYPAQNVAIRDTVINSVMDDPAAGPTARTSDGTVQTAIYVTLTAALLSLDNCDLRSNAGSAYISRNVSSASLHMVANNVQTGKSGSIRYAGQGQYTVDGLNRNNLVSCTANPALSEWGATAPSRFGDALGATVAKTTNASAYGGNVMARFTTNTTGAPILRGITTYMPLSHVPFKTADKFTTIALFDLSAGSLVYTDLDIYANSDGSHSISVYDLGNDIAAAVITYGAVAADVTNGGLPLWVGVKSSVANGSIFDLLSVVTLRLDSPIESTQGSLIPLAFTPVQSYGPIWLNTPPANGNNNKGDIIYNSAPASGAPQGWMFNTVGVWVSLPNL
jgi:hypothetical protein